jgi:serine/threonine-protein kinase
LALQIFKPGEIVEGYRVMSELGRGAASVIYLVQDTRTKQVWALKHVDKGNEKDNRFLEQTENEYAIATKLDHPNIRKVDRFWKKRASLLGPPTECFLVMELVDGLPVDRNPPKTFEQAARVFEQTARAMAYMHAKGFVHADMKPNNIIVDADMNAKVIDLGQGCPINTVKKRIQGTPDYIAPEQVHRRPITEKTDIYNLGATMYWALTRHFIPTALAKGDSLLGTLDDALMEKPKPPTFYNPRVPELFEKLIMDCVQIDPALRPPTMNSVADRLNLVQAKLAAEGELRKSGAFRQVQQQHRAG